MLMMMMIDVDDDDTMALMIKRQRPSVEEVGNRWKWLGAVTEQTKNTGIYHYNNHVI